MTFRGDGEQPPHNDPLLSEFVRDDFSGDDENEDEFSRAQTTE